MPLKPPDVPKHIIRILDLPGFRALEDKRVVTEPPKGPLTPDFEASIDDLSKATFGITEAQTEFEPPNEYWNLNEDDPAKSAIDDAWNRHERQFGASDLPYDEKSAHLSARS